MRGHCTGYRSVCTFASVLGEMCLELQSFYMAISGVLFMHGDYSFLPVTIKAKNFPH
jgi:hypothetical protein